MRRFKWFMLVAFVLWMVPSIAYAQSIEVPLPQPPAASGLAAVGTLIASMVAVVKFIIPQGNFTESQWSRVSLGILAGVSLVVLGLAVATQTIPKQNLFQLLDTWIGFIVSASGMRELLTVATFRGNSLSDWPTRK